MSSQQHSPQLIKLSSSMMHSMMMIIMHSIA